jgi:hypothetical protein
MSRRFVCLIFILAMCLGCGALGILTRQEKEALSYLRAHPIDLDPNILTYSYIREKLRCDPGEQPTLYGIRNAYEAFWFARKVLVTFAGIEKPLPNTRPIVFQIHDFEQKELFPISLSGIHLGDSMLDTLRAAPRAIVDQNKTTATLDGPGWYLKWECVQRGSICVVVSVSCHVPGWRVEQRY